MQVTTETRNTVNQSPVKGVFVHVRKMHVFCILGAPLAPWYCPELGRV